MSSEDELLKSKVAFVDAQTKLLESGESRSMGCSVELGKPYLSRRPSRPSLFGILAPRRLSPRPADTNSPPFALLAAALSYPISEPSSNAMPPGSPQLLASTMDISELQRTQQQHEPLPPPGLEEDNEHTVYQDWTDRGKMRLRQLEESRAGVAATSRNGFMKVGTAQDAKKQRQREEMWATRIDRRKSVSGNSARAALDSSMARKRLTHLLSRLRSDLREL